MPRLISKEALPYFAAGGVPPSVLYANFTQEFTESLTTVSIEINGKPLTVTAKKQAEALVKVFERSKPYLAVMAGPHSDAIPTQAALALCLAATSGNKHKAFHWHVLTGSTTDSIRDNEVNFNELRDTKLMVISGIAANSTAMKIEKLRDLINLFGAVPLVVIIAGVNPLEYCFNTLYVKPSYVLNFGKGI